MTNVILIAGTHSWNGDGRTDWYCYGSPFDQFLIAQGIVPTMGNGRPFTWSTRLAGVFGFNAKEKLAEWDAAGENLFDYVVPPLWMGPALPSSRTNVIAHSHGLQVVLFACAKGLKINSLISMGSPVRSDMMEIARQARPNIGRWLHVHSDGSDRWQWFGELLDGHLGIVREHPLADKNDSVPGVGHSELLRDPKQFHYWIEKGWLEWLK